MVLAKSNLEKLTKEDKVIVKNIAKSMPDELNRIMRVVSNYKISHPKANEEEIRGKIDESISSYHKIVRDRTGDIENYLPIINEDSKYKETKVEVLKEIDRLKEWVGVPEGYAGLDKGSAERIEGVTEDVEYLSKVIVEYVEK